MWLLVGSAGAVNAASATEPETPDPNEVPAENGDGGGWLSRNLRHYFGNSAPSGDALDGRAVEIVDRYAEHVGKPIEVVIVHQVARFDRDWHTNQASSQALFNTVTKPFQSYTRDATIRQYVLFEQGQVVDPFLMADTERMLRDLDFIDDVRIILIPLAGEIESVAVVVETRDRWPFGAAGVVKDVGRYELNLYSSNIAGIGLRAESRLIFRDDLEPNVGYEGILRKRNIAGSFIRGELQFEDSYRRLHKGMAFDREVAHPAINWVGGISWQRTRERDAGPDPDDHELSEVWVGKVIPLGRDRASEGTARSILVPAVRFSRKTFLDRPTVASDTLTAFHNFQNYLVGLTFQRLKYYKTSYLFEMGETENVPAGVAVKISGGYRDGEFRDRTQAFFQSSVFSVRNRGDIFSARADIGGFFNDGVYEDGGLIVRGAYVTPLLGADSWRVRIISILSYYLAINRTSDSVLNLGNSTGLRGMGDNQVLGNQRLVGNFECRLFTPVSVMGFRFMLLGFLDMGAVAGEEDPVLQAKYFGSMGLAIRIQNPELVLAPIQIRVAFLNSIDDKGIGVGFHIGGPNSPRILVPGTRPGGFDFR